MADDAQGKVKAFLTAQGMYFGDISIDRTCAIFLEEMKRGLSPEKNSMMAVQELVLYESYFWMPHLSTRLAGSWRD